MKKLDTTMYFITDSTNYSEEEFLFRVEEACKGGVTLIQLREKERTTREYITLAEKVHEITKRYDIPLIIDDRVDVALAVNAEGVHVGQSDMPVSIARQLVVLLPVAYLLSLTGNLNLIWLSFPIAELMSMALSGIFLYRIYQKVIKPL